MIEISTATELTGFPWKPRAIYALEIQSQPWVKCSDNRGSDMRSCTVLNYSNNRCESVLQFQ